MANYLDKNGLLYLWQKITTKFVAKESGKGLSTNDFTNELKTKLDGIEAGATKYVLPTASADTLGGVKVGAGLAINEGVLSATGGGTADSVDWSNVQNKPTTLEGYGITDVYKKTEVYSKTEIDDKGFLTEHQDISGKADKATTLQGYGITDAYTQTQTDAKIDEKIAGKANSSDVYIKTEVYTKTETDGKIDEKIAGKADKSTTLAGYGITDAYTKTETYNKEEVDGKLSSVYKPAGNTLFANLPQPSASNLGNVYSMMDAFTTDDRFVASEPTQYPIGTNVVVIQVEDAYYFDVLAGFVDLSGYMKKTDMVAITNEEIDEIVAG